MSTNPISEAQLAANRANAQHSTGPVTDEGKAKSSMNAVKTGLTGRTILLPSDDAAIYQQHLDRIFLQFSPSTDPERALVQIVADAEWRLLRIHPLEASIWALGRLEFANEFASQPDETHRESLLQGKIYLTYKKDLANLTLQERRLTNHRKTHLAELQQLQQERIEKEKHEASTEHRNRDYSRASQMSVKADVHRRLFDPLQFGFDFSLAEMRAFGEVNYPLRNITGTDLDFPTWLANHRAAQKEPQTA
jgi:hypothetical protein